MDKVYLGDGVYIDFGDPSGDIILTTEDGIRATNTIILNLEILSNLGAVVDARLKKLEGR